MAVVVQTDKSDGQTDKKLYASLGRTVKIWFPLSRGMYILTAQGSWRNQDELNGCLGEEDLLVISAPIAAFKCDFPHF